MYSNSYLIPTENCVYGNKEVSEGHIFKSSNDPITLLSKTKVI